MKKLISLSLILVMIFAFTGCKEEEPKTNFELFDTANDSIIATISKISGDTDINVNDYRMCTFIEETDLYDLIYSKDVKEESDESFYYLIVTSETEDGKYYTQRISKSQQLLGELSEDNPYIGLTMQNSEGTVFMSIVQVLDDDYAVKYEGNVCDSPMENVYVQAADHQPDLKIGENPDAPDDEDDSDE